MKTRKLLSVLLIMILLVSLSPAAFAAVEFASDEASFTGEHDAEISAMRLASCPEDRRAALLPVINEVNAYYRWVKLVIMPDGAVNMRADAVVSEETAGGICVELFLRMMKAVDDVYPKIMKALCP